MNEYINELCKTLHNDYNGVIFDYVDNSDIKETFKYVATKFKDGDKGNIPLLNIIYNYFNGVLPSPKYISGPMSLTYQTSSKYDMKIYIFGELHGNAKQCNQLGLDQRSSNMNISQYLKNVFLNSDKFIDFYLEDEMFRTFEPDKNQDFMNLLRHDFDNCLNPTKRLKCESKTIRTHFIDTRRMHKDSIVTGTNPIENFIYDSFILRNKINHNETLYQLLKLDSHESIADYIIKIATNIPIINKELNRSYLDRKTLISIFHDIIMNWYYEMFTINKWNSMFRTNRSDADKLEILTMIQAPIVDIYTISRMFKTFKKTENFPDKPRYIIYYSGNGHSVILRRFLEKLEFEQKFERYSNTSTSTRCLNMENVSLDFK